MVSYPPFVNSRGHVVRLFLTIVWTMLLGFVGLLSGPTVSAQTIPLVVTPCMNNADGTTLTCDPSSDGTGLSSAGAATAAALPLTNPPGYTGTIAIGNDSTRCPEPVQSPTPIDVFYLQQGVFSEYFYHTGVSRGVGAPVGDCIGPNLLYETPPGANSLTNGFILPKFQVVGVLYAPPGNKNAVSGEQCSQVTYGGGFTSNYTYSDTQSYSNKNSQTTSYGGSVSFFGFTISGSASTTNTFTQKSTLMNATMINTTITAAQGLRCSIAADGINHANDKIAVWFNPAIGISVLPDNTVVNTGLGYDPADNVITGTPDTLWIYVSDLQLLASGKPCSDTTLGQDTDFETECNQLARAWSSTGALTAADYADILKADPFAGNETLNPMDPSLNGRYSQPTLTGSGTMQGTTTTIATGTLISYGPGTGQSIATFTAGSTTTSTTGSTAEDTHSVQYTTSLGLSEQNGGSGKTSGGDTSKLTAGLMDGTTYTYSNKVSTTNSNASSQTASYIVYGPLVQDDYTGLQQLAVYQDNIYGTFVFYPE